MTEHDIERTDTDESVTESADGPSTADLAGRGRDARAAGAEQDADSSSDDAQPLLPEEDVSRFRERWGDIQTRFVDEPQRAVEEGDALVATVMQRLAETFADERSRLEEQWDRDEDVSTEELRIALQRYRSFFTRLLAA